MILQILGASGTGKSTLGSALAREMGFPLLRSDHYLWPNEEFDVPRPVQERRRMLQEDIDRFPSLFWTAESAGFRPKRSFPIGLCCFVALRRHEWNGCIAGRRSASETGRTPGTPITRSRGSF